MIMWPFLNKTQKKPRKTLEDVKRKQDIADAARSELDRMHERLEEAITHLNERKSGANSR